MEKYLCIKISWDSDSEDIPLYDLGKALISLSNLGDTILTNVSKGKQKPDNPVFRVKSVEKGSIVFVLSTLAAGYAKYVASNLIIGIAKGATEYVKYGYNSKTKTNLKKYVRDFFASLVDMKKVTVSMAFGELVGDSLSTMFTLVSTVNSCSDILNRVDVVECSDKNDTEKQDELLDIAQKLNFSLSKEDFESFIALSDYQVPSETIVIDVVDSNKCDIKSRGIRCKKVNLIVSQNIKLTPGEQNVKVLANINFERTKVKSVEVLERI